MKVGLVQFPYEFVEQAYLPYTICSLQAYAETHLKNIANYEFMVPICYRPKNVSVVVQELASADIVAFSCYVWNEQLSLEIARCLKVAKPNTIIVFGGPQIPDPFDKTRPWIQNRAETYLKEHSFIDILCHGEGERVFTSVLENWQGDWSSIPSISFRTENGLFVQTLSCGRMMDLSGFPSPYLKGTFDQLLEKYPEQKWIGALETNRGCPYRCTFCGWGGLVGQKFVPFDYNRVLAEIEWFGQHKVSFVFVCDANFGIMDRDLNIAQYVTRVRDRYGYPEVFSIQNAKNVTERVYEIHQVLTRANMEKVMVLALQSDDPETLKAVKRSNIKSDHYRELNRRAQADGIPTATELILPLPGETFQTFTEGVVGIMENSGSLQVNQLSIEPDAEMSDPQYQERYSLKSVKTRALTVHGAVEGEGIRRAYPHEDEFIHEYQIIVIETATMSREDWVQAKVFSWSALFLYFARVLGIPFVLLHKYHKVSYHRLLAGFLTDELDSKRFSVLLEIRRMFHEKAEEIQRGGFEYVAYNGMWWPINEFVLIWLVREGKLDSFYQEVEVWLTELLIDEVILPNLIHEAILLNQGLLKIPDECQDRELALRYDVGKLYKGTLEGEMPVIERGNYTYKIPHSKQTWNFAQWCTEVVWWCAKGGKYLRDFSVTAKPEPPGHY